MQKVERQKKRNRGHKRIMGLLLCALLFAGGVTGGILLGNKAQEAPEPARAPVAGAITRRAEDELKSI